MAVFIGIAKMITPTRGMIIAILTAPALFFGWMFAAGVTGDDVRALGLLSGVSVRSGGLLNHPGFWGLVDWPTILGLVPLILAVVSVALMALVITLGAIEVVTRSDISANEVLKHKGATNVCLGLFGAAPGYVSIASVGISMASGRPGPAVGLTTCCLLAFAAFNAELLVAWTPRFVTAGLLIYVGFSILWDWFLGQYHRIGRTDWLVALTIIVAALALGILPAVAVGIVAAIILFVIHYARLPVIRAETTLAMRRSTVDRRPAELARLEERAGVVSVMSVQGFLFFGSLDGLVNRLRALMEGPDKIELFILDFRHVSGVDAAAVEAFKKLGFLAQRRDMSVWVVGAAPEILGKFEAGGILAACTNMMISGEPLDTALERAENWLLGDQPPQVGADMARATLLAHFENARIVDALLGKLPVIDVAKGTKLISKGDRATETFLIDSERLSVFAGDGNLRVRSFLAGSFVGEIASFVGERRTADVVADEDSRVYVISSNLLKELEKSDPGVVVGWYRMMAATLAERVERTNRLLGDVMD